MNKPLEKDIEARVCEYARSKGVLAYKFTSPSRAAVPDRLFIAPDGRVWFCEFKREGQKATISPANRALVIVGYCSNNGSTTPAAAKSAITIPIRIGINIDQDIDLNLCPA